MAVSVPIGPPIVGSGVGRLNTLKAGVAEAWLSGVTVIAAASRLHRVAGAVHARAASSRMKEQKRITRFIGDYSLSTGEGLPISVGAG